MLKQWARRRNISKLPLDPNDDTPRCPPDDEEVEEDEGNGDEVLSHERLMASAEEC
jgi:hypothetical protein